MTDEIQTTIDSIEALESEIRKIQQPRSDFVLKHFVAGQHDLPGRQRAQVVLELQQKLFALRRGVVQREQLLLKKRRARKAYDTGDEVMQQDKTLEMQEADIDLDELSLAMLGAVREANTLLAILGTMPTYTRAQMEKEEAEYWGRRLTRQYMVGGRDIGGNLDAVLQVLTEPGQAKPQVLGTITDVKGLLGIEG